MLQWVNTSTALGEYPGECKVLFPLNFWQVLQEQIYDLMSLADAGVQNRVAKYPITARVSHTIVHLTHYRFELLRIP